MQHAKSVYIEFYIGVYCGSLKKCFTCPSVFLVCIKEGWRDFNYFSKSEKRLKLCDWKTSAKSSAASTGLFFPTFVL